MLEVLIIMVLTALSCSLIGAFLMLRGTSMISDAISHSVLLGIIVFYFVVQDTQSPLLFVGAALAGLLTVLAIELLIKTKLVAADSAIGIVFPLFFSIAVILVARFASRVHIDTDCIIMGDVIFAPLNTVELLGMTLPLALVQMGVMLVLVLVFITLSFKELKIASFDPVYAQVSGIKTSLIHYAIMTLTSFVTVYAFENVGAILVVSFMITPAAIAYMFSKNLSAMLVLTALISVFVSCVGVALAFHFDVNVAGVCAAVAGLLFVSLALVQPKGVIYKLIHRRRALKLLEDDLVLLQARGAQNVAGGASPLAGAWVAFSRLPMPKNIHFTPKSLHD